MRATVSSLFMFIVLTASAAIGQQSDDFYGTLLREGKEAFKAERMIELFQLVPFAASLGGVETTVSYPEITSHRSMTAVERASLGVGPGTVRVSVGIEDPDDIVADFTQALSRSC